MAASGTFGYGVEFAHLVDLNRLGGIVVKGLSLEPMAGAAAPRLCETPSGMLNAVGLQNIGVRAFVAEKLPALCAPTAPPSLRMCSDTTVEEYVGVIRILEEAEGLAAYELNISCPNTAHGGSSSAATRKWFRRWSAARPKGRTASPVGETLTECDRYSRHRQRGRRCRGRCPDRRQHLPGHECGRPDTKIEAWQDHWRPFGPRDQADHPTPGIRGQQGGQDSHRRPWRDRERPRMSWNI